MTLPNVKTTLVDRKNRITYCVLAYRTLTRAELVQAVRLYRSRQRKRPWPNSAITIVSVIGHDE